MIRFRHRFVLPRRPLVGLGLALVGSLLSGCGSSSAPAEPPPPTVGVVEARRMNVPILATPNGTTRALEEVAIRARVRGFLTERHFEEGSDVKKGQLLLVIDEEPYKVALQSAEARLEEAQANLSKLEQAKTREVAAAKLALDQAQLVLDQLEERRSRALVSRSAASREDLDKAEAERKKAEAQVDSDKANLEQANSDYKVNIQSAKAQVDEARAAVRNAELDLGYCRMYAPFDGRIGEAKVKVGNLVGPTSSSGVDITDLATIQQLDPMGVDVLVSSRYLERATRLIKKGLAVRLNRPALEGEKEHPYVGKCYFIDNTVDPNTSTFLVKARIPNPEQTLLPGEYVKLRLVVDEVEGAVVVPEPAVGETQSGPVVYVVDKGGKVAIQKVKAAQTYEGLRVITEGLDPGATVIVEGLQLIRPGQPVKTEAAVLPRPVRDEASEREDERAARPSSAPPRPEHEPKAIEPGGARSAVKEAEESRPAPSR